MQQASAAGQQQQFAYAGDGQGQPGGGEPPQPGAQYALDPGMQTYNGDGTPVDERDLEEHGGPGSAAAANRAVNPSKRAEQNRKAQRAFRERRDA